MKELAIEKARGSAKGRRAAAVKFMTGVLETSQGEFQ